MKNKIINIEYIFKNYFSLIIFVFIPAIVIVILFFLIVPKYDTFKNNINTALKLEEQYSKIKLGHIKELKKYKEKYDSIDQNKIKKIEKILPSKKDIPEIMNEISKIAKDVGIEISDFTFYEASGVSEIDESLEKINFSIVVSDGKDYETFKKFIKAIEDSPRLFNINSFHIDDKCERYNLEIECYYKK